MVDEGQEGEIMDRMKRKKQEGVAKSSKEKLENDLTVELCLFKCST